MQYFMFSLNNAQLNAVMVAARGVDVGRRDQFLQRVAARLRLLDRFDDADLDTAVRLALVGLHQSAA